MTTGSAARVDALVAADALRSPSAPRAAIVVASAAAGVHPLDHLAGLSLALRALLTVQKEGATRAVLVVDEGDERTEAILADRRLRIPVEVHRGDWREALRKQGEPALVVRHDVVADPAIYRALLGASLEDSAAAFAERAGVRVGPMIAAPAFADLADPEGTPRSGAAIRSFDVGTSWVERVDSPAGRRRAFHELFEACRKPVDGIVARHVNRHISIFLSKRLVSTPITPNMMSVVTFLLAVAGSACAARGGYFWTLAGAFLLQWNSILDGVDGELARTRFQHSKLGQWLDTVSDDVSNVLFYGGLSIGAASLPFGRILSLSGYVTIAATVLTCALYYTELVRVGSGDLYAIDWDFDKEPPRTLGQKVVVFFRYVFKKDFFILFFLALALVGVLPYVLPLIAAASIATLVAATLRNLGRRRAISGRARREPAGPSR